MAYTNNNGQIRVGVRSGISNSPIVQPAFSASLLQSLYGVWNGDTTTNELSTSIFGAWNGDTTTTVTTLNGSVSSAWNGDNFYSTSGITASNVNNVTLSTGKIGNAFTFNGSNYVSIPSSFMNFTGDFTANFWIKINSTAVLNQGIMGNMRWGLGPGGFQIIFNNGWLQALAGNQNNGSAGFLTQAPNGYITNFTTWTMVTFIYRKGVSNSFYINAGTPNTTAHQHTLLSSIFNGQLGSEPMDNYRLNGNLDAVTFWDRAITENEIHALYNSTNGREYPYPSTISVDIPSPNDSFGTNHGSLMNGVAFSTGKVGNAFTFDGVNDYVSFPTDSWNSLVGTDLTISLWVKFTSTANQTLISNMSSPSINVWSGWEIRLVGGQPTIYMWNNTSTGVGAQGGVVSTNTWYHIVATRKKGSRTRIYINGSLAQTDTNTPDPSISGTYYPNIGHLQYSSSFHALYMANGSLIDSVNLWSKEISADEVTQLYNSGTGAQYPFTGTFSSAGNQLGIDNGTLVNGCSLTTGKVGQAFTFDGVNDYVSLPNNSLNFTGDFSIGLWVYFNSLNNPNSQWNQQFIFSNNPIGLGNGFSLYKHSNNSLYFIISNGTNTSYYRAPQTLIQSTWYHIVITRKYGTTTKIYINGLEQTDSFYYSGVSSTNPTYLTNQVVNLSGWGNAGGDLFNGKMDAFTTWQKELTQAEVTELYNSGNGKQITATPIVQSGLVLNLDASRKSSYPDTGTTWTDISGTGNNGTMVNGPIFGTASGGQITFDGVNDYVDTGLQYSLTSSTNFTIGIWFKGFGRSSNNDILVLSYSGTPVGWAIYQANTGKFMCFSRDNNNVETTYISSTTSTNTNQWFYGVYKKSGNQFSLYINGVLEATTNANLGNISISSGMRIGNHTITSQPYLGSIGSVKVYNKSLTDSEILQNFNATKSRFGY